MLTTLLDRVTSDCFPRESDRSHFDLPSRKVICGSAWSIATLAAWPRCSCTKTRRSLSLSLPPFFTKLLAQSSICTLRCSCTETSSESVFFLFRVAFRRILIIFRQGSYLLVLKTFRFQSRLNQQLLFSSLSATTFCSRPPGAPSLPTLASLTNYKARMTLAP